MKIKFVLYIFCLTMGLNTIVYSNSPFLDSRYSSINVTAEAKKIAQMHGDPIPTFQELSKTFAHSSENNSGQEFLKALKYAEFQQALYKKVADGLELNKAVRSYASSLKNEQHVARAYSTAWQNYAAQQAKSTVSSVACSTASSIPKTAAPVVKAGSFLGAKKAVIPVSLGATAVAGYYAFKKQANAEEQSAKLEQPLCTEEKPVKIEEPTSLQQISTFCTQNPGKTAGIGVGIAALVYGAYKLYNSNIFTESKKVAELQK